MNVEYTAIEIGGDHIDMAERGVGELREWFSNGWEYVDSISQPVSVASGSYSSKTGCVIVILKKNEGVAL